MVEVKVFQDGELKGEFKGDFAVCMVSSRTDRKDVLCNKVSYAGNPPLKGIRAALADGPQGCLQLPVGGKGKAWKRRVKSWLNFRRMRWRQAQRPFWMCMEMRKMTDRNFEIKETLAVLSDRRPGGWQKELNLVSWYGREPVYDLRE